MTLDWFWVVLIAMVVYAGVIGVNHELTERRWKREREAEEAAKRPAE